MSDVEIVVVCLSTIVSYLNMFISLCLLDIDDYVLRNCSEDKSVFLDSWG